jgi:hypothetical protein
VRVALLVRVQHVVGAAGSWLAAYSARRALRAVARGAIDLVPPDADHDHDHQGGDVNQGDENDQGGQVAHFAPLLPGTSGARDDFVQLHGAIRVTGRSASERVRHLAPGVGPKWSRADCGERQRGGDAHLRRPAELSAPPTHLVRVM